jgi:hypothetical protein
MWINIPSGTNGTFIARGLSSSTQRTLQLYTFNNTLQAIVGGVTANTNQAVPGGQWVHLALVNTGTTNTVYMNGAALKTTTNGTFVNTGVDLLIGARRDSSNTSTSYYLPSGSIDDVRIYGRALTISEISSIYSLAQ